MSGIAAIIGGWKRATFEVRLQADGKQVVTSRYAARKAKEEKVT